MTAGLVAGCTNAAGSSPEGIQPPTSVQFSNENRNTLVLSWEKPVDISHYIVYVSQDSELDPESPSTTTHQPVTPPMTLNNLDPGATYNVRLVAIDEQLESSGMSAVFSGKTLEPAASIFEAIRTNDTAAFNTFITDRSFDPSSRDRDNSPLVYLAVDYDRTEMLKKLIEKGADVSEKPENHLQSKYPLFRAIEKNATPSITALLKAGAKEQTYIKNGGHYGLLDFVYSAALKSTAIELIRLLKTHDADKWTLLDALKKEYSYIQSLPDNQQSFSRFFTLLDTIYSDSPDPAGTVVALLPNLKNQSDIEALDSKYNFLTQFSQPSLIKSIQAGNQEDSFYTYLSSRFPDITASLSQSELETLFDQAIRNFYSIGRFTVDVSNYHFGNLKFLVDAGVSPDRPISFEPSLVYSLSRKPISQAKPVLDYFVNTLGADVNIKNTGGTTILINIINWSGSPEMITLFGEYGINPNATGPFGSNALFFACEDGATAYIKPLIDIGVDKNHISNTGVNPLWVAAAQNNSYSATKKLLELGANPYTKVLNKDLIDHVQTGTAIHTLIQSYLDTPLDENKTVFDLYRDKNMPALQAKLAKDSQLINSLEDGSKKTLLALAVSDGNLDYTNFFIQEGADLDRLLGNSEGTALHIAVKTKFLSGIEALLKAGADSSTTISGEYIAKAILWLGWHGDKVPEILALFNKYNGDFALGDNDNFTLIAVALNYGHKHVIDALFDVIPSETLLPALSRELTRYYHAEHVTYLIEKGAPLDYVDTEKRNIISQLLKNMVNAGLPIDTYITHVQTLIQAGVPIHTLDINGKAALNYAHDINNEDLRATIMNILINHYSTHVIPKNLISMTLSDAVSLSSVKRYNDYHILNWGLILNGRFSDKDLIDFRLDNLPLLTYAARENDESAINTLLSKGADINLSVRGYGTALHAAVKSKSIAAIATLLEAGADTTIKNTGYYISKAIHNLGWHGDHLVEIIKLFNTYNGDLALDTSNHNTLLDIAIFYGHLTTVIDALVETVPKEKFQPALNRLLASPYAHSHLSYLLEKGASVDYTDSSGKNLISQFLVNNRYREDTQGTYLAYLKALITAGVPVHTADTDGKTALNYAANLNNADFKDAVITMIANHYLTTLIPNKTLSLTLDQSVSLSTYIDPWDDTHIINWKLILEQSFTEDELSNYRLHKTPLLSYAAKANNTDAITRLIAKGVPIDTSIDFHGTALHEAVKSKSLNAIETLLKAGVDSSVKASRSTLAKPIHVLAWHGVKPQEIIDIFHRYQADLALSTASNNDTLIDIAIEYGNLPQIIEALKASVSTDLWLPALSKGLVTLSIFGNEATYDYMIDQGASPTFKDEQGRNLLSIAVVNYRQMNEEQLKKISRSLDLLIKAGVSPNEADIHGKTALDYADEITNAHYRAQIKALFSN